jgi:hypothetical protein
LIKIPCAFCGEELLLIPDARAMDRANEAHAHKKPKPKGHFGVDPVDIVNDLARQEIEALTVDPLEVQK